MNIKIVFDILFWGSLGTVLAAFISVVVFTETSDSGLEKPPEVKIHCHDIAKNERVWLRRCSYKGEAVYVDMRSGNVSAIN